MKIYSRVRRSILWAFRIALMAAIPYSIHRHDYLFVFGVLLAIIFSLLPAFWYRSLKVTLPFELDMLISIVWFLHIILGEVFRFYDDVWYFDKIMHFYGTGLIALLAFFMVFTLHWSDKVRLSLPFIALFTIVFALALGSLWEIGEFTIDQLFGRNTQYGLENTMWDLIFNTVGASFAALLGVLYTRKKNRNDIAKLIDPFRKISGIY